MRKKLQIIVSVTTFLIILGGSLALNTITRKMIYNAIREQVLMDNKSIGEEILRFLKKNFEAESEGMIETQLQNLCDDIMLPNEGFICAIRNDGELVAAPGLQSGSNANLDIVDLSHGSSDSFDSFSGFDSDTVYAGIINFEKGTRTNIIASIPIGTEDIRLNIHQDNNAIERRAREAVKPLLAVSLVAAFLLSILGYLLVNSIVSRYESTIEQQNRIISKKNKEMMSSIRYARFLQSSYLPSRRNFEGLIDDFFIFQQPKDIVSGDFFWVDRKKDKIYFSVIDCTGHGVPGSLLSMIAYGLLEQALHETNNNHPAEILDFICNRFSQASASHTGETNLNDGMDISLCSLDRSSKILEYSGARNPLWMVQSGELKVYDATRKSIGGKAHEGEKSFTNNTIEVSKGDMLYLFSDGYADQFGGPENRKFMKKRFMGLLTEISNLPMEKQHDKLAATLSEWMGDNEQIDDILVMGIRV